MQTGPKAPVLDLARRYVESGISVIPIKPDGSKAPALKEWKSYQEHIPTDDELRRMFRNGVGLAAICGGVSGGLECLDFEANSSFEEWVSLVKASDDNVLKKTVDVSTPSGGVHIIYRSTAVEGNQKLAMRWNADEEKSETLIETRGEGGYFLLPGSPPECHPTKKCYEVVVGCDFNQIQEITPEERNLLLTCARIFNEYVRPQQNFVVPKFAAREEKRPGDDYNERGDVLSVLKKHGWQVAGQRGETTLLRRPGKKSGVSATFNFGNSGRFYNFSTSAHPFEHDRAYSPFAVYSLLEHDGDFNSAARELVQQGYGATQADQHEWLEPHEIRTELLPVPELPPDVIPAPFRDWLTDIAYRMQCPLDFLATAAIVMVGSVIGAACGIRPKRRDDWIVIPNLWGAAVGRPGIVLKSPSLNEAMKPLSTMEAQAKKEFDLAARAHEAEEAMSKAEREALKEEMKKAAKGTSKISAEDLKRRYAQTVEPGGPTWRRFKTNDATIEKMSELLAENPRGILLFRDELTGLLQSWDKDGRETDRAFYLEAWNGYGDNHSDRIGRGTVYTPNLCVSIFGSIQPARLVSCLYRALKGNDNDGLIQRLQLLVYPDEPKNSKVIDERPDGQARDRAYIVIERLVEMDFTAWGASPDEEGKTPYMRFDGAAQELFFEWLSELYGKLQMDDEPVMTEHLSKYRSLMPSLALIFHLIEIADGVAPGPVCLACAERAAAMCSYLEAHARRVYGLVGSRSGQATANLAAKIREGALMDGFTVRDIYRKEWSLLDSRDSALAACEDLVEAGWLREIVTEPAAGQKPKIQYVINPAISRPEKLHQTPNQQPDKPDSVKDSASVSGMSGSHLGISEEKTDSEQVRHG